MAARRKAGKQKREKKVAVDERLGDLDKVIAIIEQRVDVKVEERGLLQRVGMFERNDREISGKEVKELPKNAKWAIELRGALESGKPKNLDKV